METNDKTKEVQTVKTVEVKSDVVATKEPVKEPVQTEFNFNCPGCNVKLKVDTKSKKLTLRK